MTHPFTKKLTTSPSKTLALLGLGVLLTTAAPTLRAQEDYESIRSAAQRFSSVSASQPYQIGSQKFLEFWEHKGPTIHGYLDHSPSTAFLDRRGLQVRALNERPLNELFAKWHAALFHEIDKITRKEFPVHCDSLVPGVGDRKIIELPGLLRDESWDDAKVRTTLEGFYTSREWNFLTLR